MAAWSSEEFGSRDGSPPGEYNVRDGLHHPMILGPQKRWRITNQRLDDKYMYGRRCRYINQKSYNTNNSNLILNQKSFQPFQRYPSVVPDQTVRTIIRSQNRKKCPTQPPRPRTRPHGSTAKTPVCAWPKQTCRNQATMRSW